MALRECKLLPMIGQCFPSCLPGGSTIFGGGLPYLAMVKNPSMQDMDADLNHHQTLITSKLGQV